MQIRKMKIEEPTNNLPIAVSPRSKITVGLFSIYNNQPVHIKHPEMAKTKTDQMFPLVPGPTDEKNETMGQFYQGEAPYG